MWDPYAEFRSVVLPNGLTIYAAHWPGRPWEAMGFLIHSGAEHDPVGLEGLFHFVEHLVGDNAGVPSQDMSAFFHDCGGMVDFGTTNYPDTRYRFFVPVNRDVFSKAFSMFGQMLLSAKLENGIEEERQVIIREFRQHYPIKFTLDLEMRERKALYAGYWLERFVGTGGTPESVRRITQSDLQSHYEARYTPANMSVVGVGGMKIGELIKLLSKSPFGMSKKGARTPLPRSVTKFAPLEENRYVFKQSEYFKEPAEAGGYRSVARIPGNVNIGAIRILEKMLDRVLMEEVRGQRAWVYKIESSWRSFRQFYELSINCGGLALEALDEIEDVLETCIASLADDEKLLKQVKRYALASNFMIDSTGKGICNEVLDDLANHQRIISLAEYCNDIERATMGDIRSLLQWLRPEQRWTLIVQP